MILQQAAPLFDFSSALAGRLPRPAAPSLADIRPSHAEISQVLRNRLQGTLDLAEILDIFYTVSQQLVAFQGLQFGNAHQHIAHQSGRVEAQPVFRMDYNLELKNEQLGMLSILHSAPLSENELVSLESLTANLVFPLRNALKYHAALHASLHDPLTGVRNRSSLRPTLERDMETARRMQQPMAVIMFDIDHFKLINDTYGHAGGDKVLVEVARLISARLRSVDAVFRYGGEEFCISLPHTDAAQASLVAERLRHAIEQLEVEFDQQIIRLTASMGMAILAPAEQQDDFIQRADNALYSAKHSGRNRVCLAD